MTDRELLERAAKAAGIAIEWHTGLTGEKFNFIRGTHTCWNPLQDDGDSARLEAALQMSVEWNDAPQNVYVGTDEIGYYEPYGSDRQAARRRAGVRAAAAMVPA